MWCICWWKGWHRQGNHQPGGDGHGQRRPVLHGRQRTSDTTPSTRLSAHVEPERHRARLRQLLPDQFAHLHHGQFEPLGGAGQRPFPGRHQSARRRNRVDGKCAWIIQRLSTASFSFASRSADSISRCLDNETDIQVSIPSQRQTGSKLSNYTELV